jgi:hypothetical protein
MRRGYTPHLHDQYSLSGEPFDIGLQRGKLALEKEKQAYKDFTYAHMGRKIPKEEYNIEKYKSRYPKLHAKWEQMVDSQPEWALQELRGLAEGAGLPFEKVLLKQIPIVFPESIGDPDGFLQPRQIGLMEEDCSGFVAFGDAVAGGKTLLGSNAENTHGKRRTDTITYIKNKKGHNLVEVHIGTPGSGLNTSFAMNDQGLCLWCIGVSAVKEEKGIIGHLILNRMALNDCDNVDEALEYYKNAKRLVPKRIDMIDTERGASIEFTANHYEVLEPESGFQTGSSPVFTSPKMRRHNYYISDETDPRFSYTIAPKRTDFRVERYQELLEQFKPLTPGNSVKLLADHGGRGASPDLGGPYEGANDYTICAHGSKVGDDFHSLFRSSIAVPSKKSIYVAFGSPCEAEFIQFKVPEK